MHPDRKQRSSPQGICSAESRCTMARPLGVFAHLDSLQLGRPAPSAGRRSGERAASPRAGSAGRLLHTTVTAAIARSRACDSRERAQLHADCCSHRRAARRALRAGSVQLAAGGGASQVQTPTKHMLLMQRHMVVSLQSPCYLMFLPVPSLVALPPPVPTRPLRASHPCFLPIGGELCMLQTTEC